MRDMERKRANDRKRMVEKRSHKEKRGKLIQLIRNIKVTRGCADCGYNKHWAALDFDHLRNKLFNISCAVNRGFCWAKILEEIAKCDVVCANCHRVRTADRRAKLGGSPPPAELTEK